MRWPRALLILGTPPGFFRFSGRLLPWLSLAALVVTAVGLYGGLFLAPPDYQQQDAFRIIYVHVPAAWLSLFVYGVMVIAALGVLVWRWRLAELALAGSVPLGALFTAMALITGSLWGRPMWGTWWVWDARLTAELLLLFIYLAIGALYRATDDRRHGARLAAVLTLVGAINLPVIHFSVEWWNTLHQGSTVRLFGSSSMHPDMLWPLLVTAMGFKLLYGALLLWHMRILLLEQENPRGWLGRMLRAQAERTTS